MAQNPQPHRFTYDPIRDGDLIQKAGVSLEVFETVLEAINTQHFEVIDLSLLEKLYYLLVYLSSDTSPHCSTSRSSNCLGFRSHQFDYTLKFTDICDLSNFLFTELSRRFELLFSHLCDVALFSLHLDAWGPQQELTLLLRCCMVILHLIELDPTILSQRCQTLLNILRRLCSSKLLPSISWGMRRARTRSISLKRSVSCEALTSSIEQSKSPISVLCSFLEVFLDELLVHRKLRQYFVIMDSLSCATEKLFICHFSNGDIDAVLEVISAHFCLAVIGGHAVKTVPEKLFLQHAKVAPSLELSLTAALQLLGLPVMFSAPQVFQAYVISLVSRCMDIVMTSEDERTGPTVLNIYISAFERSFILYTDYMSSLEFSGIPLGAQGESTSCYKPCPSKRGLCPFFEHRVRPRTYKRINLEINNIDDKGHTFFSKTRSDLLTRSILYMKEKEHILEKSNRDEILSVLSCIISLSVDGKLEGILLHKSGNVNEQQMYLLASIVNLMGYSLLRTIGFMQEGSLGCKRTLKDNSCCREYDFIIGIISCFGHQNASQSSQLLLPQVMGASPACHKESKMMLFHFAGLLLFSFDNGHEFLGKACMFMMMTLMTLIVFEDGNTEMLKLLLSLTEESLPLPSATIISEVMVKQSTLEIASKFHHIQMLNLRRDSSISNVIETQCTPSEPSGSPMLIKDVEEDGTCKGESFLNVINKGKLHDFDKLANFVACKQEKDYSTWLKDRYKFRTWAYEKRAVLKKEKKMTELMKLDVARKLSFQ